LKDHVHKLPSESAAFLRSQESSVRHLQQLYTIVSGLALSDAISTIFRGDIKGDDWYPVLALLAAFVATLIPFFHGAMRHLDDAYLIDEAAPQAKPVSLAVDFFFLFIEGLILFLLAHWLLSPDRFVGFVIALLVVDIVWAVTFHFLSPETRRVSVELQLLFHSPASSDIAQMQWVINNLLFIPVIAVTWWISSSVLDIRSDALALVLAPVIIARTVFDYRKSWAFYFPGPDPRSG
jgi:hypothetical protein